MDRVLSHVNNKRSSFINKLSYISLSLPVFFFSTSYLHGQKKDTANWTVLIFLQAENSLASFANKNFDAIKALWRSKKFKKNNINIVAQWHRTHKQGTYRYHINDSKLILDEHIAHDTHGNKATDLVEAMRWAVKKYPATKYCLVLWNHGLGILDPPWDSSMNAIYHRSMRNHRRRSQFKHITFKENLQPLHRGILFNERTKTYMSNPELVIALDTIKNEILHGKKIDLIGMDACLMAMLEVTYQIKDYAHYFVGSQEVELAYGWHYTPFLEQMSHNKAPLEIAQTIVSSFKNFYKNKVQFYTQSAINLNKIHHLKDEIDHLSYTLLDCINIDKTNQTKQALKNARKKSVQFSAVSYIDLHSLLCQLQRELTPVRGRIWNKKLKLKINETLNIIAKATKTLEECVGANATGKYLTQARGISIYFPQKPIHESYKKTKFYNESSWPKLLHSLYQ